MSRAFACIALALPLAAMAFVRASAPPVRVQLTIATLHAAALTSPRQAGDSTDAPFFVFQVVAAHGSSAAVLPDTGKRRLRENEQFGVRPLTQVSLAAGDSVEVLVSVLENRKLPTALLPASGVRAVSSPEQLAQATRLTAPLVHDGARMLGAVSVLMTNEDGAIYWRRMDCVVSCKVLTAPASTALPTPTGQTANSVVELSGNGATYHLALRANREQ